MMEPNLWQLIRDGSLIPPWLPVQLPNRHSSFAHQLMLSEFGKLGHLHDDQWADHVDVDPETLAEKRFHAIWGGR